MVLIDTNYILRFLTKTPEEHYQKALELFKNVAIRETKAIISEGVLMECYFVLSKFYKWDKELIIKSLEMLLEMRGIVCNEKAILLKALDILKEKNIDFIDALLCAKAKVFGYEVRSFDEDIRKCLED